MQDGLKTQYRHYDHQKCFVGYSHNAPWRDDIISACEETLPKFGLRPWYADDQFEPTKSLCDKVVEMVANARYGLYDLSWWRPDTQSAWRMPQNVLIEVGMAIALNRPLLLLRHAENRMTGVALPSCLDSIGQHIIEFSGGPTLKRTLEERIPQWLDVPPERAWWARYCLFGQRVCPHRESYPQIIQCGQETIRCHIADGQDVDRPDFRTVIEDELGRYSDISFDYLDALAPVTGYDFLLCTHCQTVRSTPFAIYRITPQTPAETFIAIGMSIALEKQFKCEIPKFIFTTDARSVPSLLAGHEVVEAKTTRERQKHLQKFIPVVMRKVREGVWKPGPLPFVEFVPRHTEQPKPDKEDGVSELEQEKGNRDENFLMTVSQRLRQERLQRDLSQGELATKIGASSGMISRWERNASLPNATFRRLLSDFFGKSLVELGFAENNSSQDQKDVEPQEKNEDAQRDLRNNKRPGDATRSYLLRSAREKYGWTQEELAEKIGTTVATVSRWESGVVFPSPYFRKKLSTHFGKNLAELGLVESGFAENNGSQDQKDVEPQERSEDAQREPSVKKSEDATPNYLLRNMREKQGLTQEELAEELGITRVTVSRWESGVTVPNRYFRKKLSNLYNMSIDELGLL